MPDCFRALTWIATALAVVMASVVPTGALVWCVDGDGHRQIEVAHDTGCGAHADSEHEASSTSASLAFDLVFNTDCLDTTLGTDASNWICESVAPWTLPLQMVLPWTPDTHAVLFSGQCPQAHALAARPPPHLRVLRSWFLLV